MLNIISPINQLGYGIAGLNICKMLNQECRASLFPIGKPEVTNKEDGEIISDMINRSVFFDYNAPAIKIWHQHDMSSFVGRGTRIGFPIFELDSFTDVEQHSLSSLDKILVCSSWAKSIILKEIDIKEEDVHVVPLGVDKSIFKSQGLPTQENSPTVFFNCGKWEVRKGHDILINAFNMAFNQEDNVELWMMCENPFYTPSEQGEWESLYENSPIGADKIKILKRVETQAEVYNIMSYTDCGVFPSRAEGWNLELLEMMACGKPVITTNYSAHTEFCTKENSMLVSIDELEMAYDVKWFDGKVGSWASLGDKQIEEICSHMRTIHSQKQNGTLKQNLAGIETARSFGWANTSKKIVEVLENV